MLGMVLNDVDNRDLEAKALIAKGRGGRLIAREGERSNTTFITCLYDSCLVGFIEGLVKI